MHRLGTVKSEFTVNVGGSTILTVVDDDVYKGKRFPGFTVSHLPGNGKGILAIYGQCDKNKLEQEN
jgi:hypothetical protein